MGERSEVDPDQLLQKGLKTHCFLEIKEAIEAGGNLRFVVDNNGLDWTAQHIVLSDARHRLNLLLYPQ